MIESNPKTTLTRRERKERRAKMPVLKVDYSQPQAFSDALKQMNIPEGTELELEQVQSGVLLKPLDPAVADEMSMAWTMAVIKEAQEEQARNPMTVEEELAEEVELAAYGEAQAKKLGIKEEDVMDIIYEFRREKQQRSQSGT